MASVASRVFAITGGASGIGAATARLLAHRGASGICVGDISNQHFGDLEEAIQKINPSTKLLCTILDVTSSAEVDRWIQSVIATFGNLHGAANIAGIAQGGGMRETPTILLEKDEEWHKIIRTNLDGIFYATRAEVRAMNDPLRSSLDRSIVNVGSIAGMYHEPDVYAYGTSKGACSYFTKCVAKDVFPSGIRVNNVSPGITMTPLLPHFSPKAKTIDEVKELYVKEGFSLLQPDDVARTIVWLLSEDSRPVHGADINVGASMP